MRTVYEDPADECQIGRSHWSRYTEGWGVWPAACVAEEAVAAGARQGHGLAAKLKRVGPSGGWHVDSLLGDVRLQSSGVHESGQFSSQSHAEHSDRHRSEPDPP